MSRVDYTLVRQLRSAAAERLRAERRRRAEDGGAVLSLEDERELGRSVIAATVEEHRRAQLVGAGVGMAGEGDDAALAAAVEAALFGLGRLEPLLADESIAHIDINGCDQVWLDRVDGSRVRGPAVADSDAELVEWVRTAAMYAGLSSRPFDPVSPKLELRLPDGSRLCAVMSVVRRPSVSIRCYRLTKVLLDDLRAREAFDDQLHAFLVAAVLGRCNVIVSGETFAGKTTMVRALGNVIPPNERLITAEHFLELGFDHFPDLHPDVVALEERLANAEGVGAVTLHDLVEWSRRMNPDRIIVGEVIGGEIVAMLDAMTQGEDGSLSTIHARDSRNVFARIATYALESAQRMPVEASGMLTAGALDFVVHVTKAALPDGRVHRFVSSVREVVGWDGRQVVSSEVFATPPGALAAVPAAPVTEARAERLAAYGYSPRAWTGAW